MRIVRQWKPIRARRKRGERPTRWYFAENAAGQLGIGRTADEARRDLRHDYRASHGGARQCAADGCETR